MSWLRRVVLVIDRVQDSAVGQVVVLVLLAAIVALAIWCPLPEPIRSQP